MGLAASVLHLLAGTVLLVPLSILAGQTIFTGESKGAPEPDASGVCYAKPGIANSGSADLCRNDIQGIEWRNAGRLPCNPTKNINLRGIGQRVCDSIRDYFENGMRA